MIVIYDTIENKVLAGPMEAYRVDGRKGRLEPHQVILTIVANDPPVYNANTHKLIMTWVRDNSNYVQTYQTIAKTTEELEQDFQNAIPQKITKKQLALAMWEYLTKDFSDIRTWITNNIANAKNRKIAQIEIDFETEFDKENLLLDRYFTAQGMTARQKHNFFIQASKM